MKSLIGFGVLALAVGIGYAKADSLAKVFQPKVIVMGNYIEAAGSNQPVAGDVVLGSTQTSPSHLTDSGTLNSQGSLYLWDTQVGGGLEVAGASWFAGTSSFAGRVISGGAVTSLTGVATSTLTAAQVCASSLISITPVSNTPTITFPATTTLFANCLTSNGQTINLDYRAITTSTVLAAGTGGTALNSSSSTVAAGKGAQIRLIRDSDTTYLLDIVNLLN